MSRAHLVSERCASGVAERYRRARAQCSTTLVRTHHHPSVFSLFDETDVLFSSLLTVSCRLISLRRNISTLAGALMHCRCKLFSLFGGGILPELILSS